MLTRRNFTGVAGCAICGLAEFIAAGASAQTTPPATTPGVTRKIYRRRTVLRPDP